MPEPPELETPDYSERDSASIKILGFFFAVLGTLVLIGTFWSLENPRAVTVNVASGSVLTLIGLGMLVLVHRKSNRNQ